MSSVENVKATVDQGLDHLAAASPDVVSAKAAEMDVEAPLDSIESLTALVSKLIEEAGVLETQIIPESVNQASNAKNKFDEALHASNQTDAVMAIGYADLLTEKNQNQAASARELRIKYERAMRSLSHARQHLSSALAAHADIIYDAEQGVGYAHEARANAEFYKDNRL